MIYGGENSVYEGDGECVCEEGYVKYSDACVDEISYCRETYAEGSIYVGDEECECQPGFEESDGVCVKSSIASILVSKIENVSSTNSSDWLSWLMALGIFSVCTYGLVKLVRYTLRLLTSRKK